MNVLAAISLAVSLHTITAAPVSALAFGPDGTILASSGYESIALRDPKDGKVRDSLPCEFPRVTSLAFHPDGRMLAAGGGTPGASGMGVLIDHQDKTVTHRFDNFTDLVTSVAFGPDGKIAGVASADHFAWVYSLDRSNSVALRGHSGPVLAIAFSPAGDLVLTGSADRSIKVWSLPDGKLLRSFNHHTEPVNALAFRPGKDSTVECASASNDRTVRIWQPAIGRMVRIIRGHGGPIFALSYSPDGKSLFSAGKEGIVRRLDVESDEVLEQWAAHDEAIYSLAISPDGTTLATGDWAGNIKTRNLDSGPGAAR